jgi:hypothetical protein
VHNANQDRIGQRPSQAGRLAMKGAIASVEIYVHRENQPVQRLTLVIGEPRPAGEGPGWTCRVALADLHRPESLTGTDSVDALAQALARGRSWLAALEIDGFGLFRDRLGKRPYLLD